jgi:hypothetical protein
VTAEVTAAEVTAVPDRCTAIVAAMARRRLRRAEAVAVPRARMKALRQGAAAPRTAPLDSTAPE